MLHRSLIQDWKYIILYIVYNIIFNHQAIFHIDHYDNEIPT